MSLQHMHILDRSSFIWILISIFVGIFLGLFDNQIILATSQFIVAIFMNFLKFVSTPLLFLAISSTIASLNNSNTANKIFKKTIFYTLITTIIAAITAAIIYMVISPANSTISILKNHSLTTENIFKHLSNMAPDNMIKIFLESNVIAIVIAALLIGFVSLSLEDKYRNNVINFLDSFFHLFIKIAIIIIKNMPYILWAFIIVFMNDIKSGAQTDNLLLYFAAVIIANFIQSIIILPLFLKFKKIEVYKTLKCMLPALITAFFSKSSSATMPTTISCAQEKLKLNKEISNLTIPLCTCFNMNACAAFIYITVFFVAESNGIVFTTFDYFIWIILATIAAIGNAGVPMGCFFMASAFLASMNVPTYLMGLILPFYAILDMFETTINVWSDICVAAVVDREIKI